MFIRNANRPLLTSNPLLSLAQALEATLDDAELDLDAHTVKAGTEARVIKLDTSTEASIKAKVVSKSSAKVRGLGVGLGSESKPHENERQDRIHWPRRGAVTCTLYLLIPHRVCLSQSASGERAKGNRG